MKAQASAEFLAMVGLGIGLFAVSALIYAAYLDEAGKARSYFEAQTVCLRIASEIGSLASIGGNTSYSLDLPEYINGQNYSAWLVSSPALNRSLAKVNYNYSGNIAGAGCRLPYANITNSSGSATFPLARNATIISYYGVLKVVP